MPLYSARSLDVLGNPVDGYEVNDTRSLGEVYVVPLDWRTSTPREKILQALIDRDILGGAEDDVQVEETDADGNLEVQLVEAAWAGTIDEPRFIGMASNAPPNTREFIRAQTAARRQLRTDEELDLVGGIRPIFSLEPQFISDNLAEEEFWSSEPERHVASLTRPNGWRTYTELAYDEESQRIQARVLIDDGDTSDVFEWQLVDWRRRPSLGWDPVSSEEILPSKGQLEQILVAMDTFMETGEARSKGDAECTVCGQMYESGHAGDRKFPICERCAAKQRR